MCERCDDPDFDLDDLLERADDIHEQRRIEALFEQGENS